MQDRGHPRKGERADEYRRVEPGVTFVLFDSGCPFGILCGEGGFDYWSVRRLNLLQVMARNSLRIVSRTRLTVFSLKKAKDGKFCLHTGHRCE